MPLIDAWKAAKQAFETTTGKKKPSVKFMGVFGKGTGIGSALKEVDGAKTGADLGKALKKFEAAYVEYIKQLEKAAGDPTAVPTGDKAVYVGAIKALKTSLDKIHTDGEKIQETMQGVGAKEKVDSNAMKEANDHLALRKKVAAECLELNTDLKKAVADLNNRMTLVDKQLAAAKDAAKSSNTMMHQVAVGVIDRHIDEGEAIFEANKKKVADFTKEGSPMMKARMDPKGAIDKLPESIRKDYTAKSNAAWSPVSKLAAEQNTMVQQMQAVVQKMKAAKASAEGSGNQMKSPQEYITTLTKLKSEIDSAFKAVTIKSDRVVKSVAEFDTKLASFPTKEEKEKHCKLQEDQWNRYAPEIKAVRDRISSMKTQATSLPQGALEDSKVESAADAAEKAADAAVKTLNDHLKAGAELEKKLGGARAKMRTSGPVIGMKR